MSASLSLLDNAPGDPRNAAFLAIACELAYLDEAAAAERYLSELGLKARLIAFDNTQVYVGENESAIVVAFRGSQSPDTFDGLKDWLLTNANNFLILPEGRIGTDFAAAGVGARFHKGFLEALDEIWTPLHAAVDAAMTSKERKLWVTGHSLGGALALLAAWRFQQNFLAVHEVYTFGAPMVGNEAAAAAFQREFPGKIHRFVNDLDPVPLLPTVSLIANAYTHCLAEQILSAQSSGDGPNAATAFVQELAGRTKDGLLDALLIDDLWACVKSRVEYHMVDSYKSRIDGRCKSTA